MGWKDNIQEEEGPAFKEEEGPAFKNRNVGVPSEVFARTPTQGSVSFLLISFCNKIEFSLFLQYIS